VKSYIVSHTHWDREWYLTKEGFREMLISLVDGVLSLLEDDPAFPSFMLDGQAMVLEDYCEVKPGNQSRLERLIRAGRLIVGPWYILPDEFLAGGETHIRNFLIGWAACAAFGGGTAIGYLPDSFGHPSQMPQLLAGLGLHEIVFWRGLGPDVTETELLWHGKDGSTVFGVNMPFGYGVAACLPEEPAAFTERLEQKMGLLSPLTRSGCILLMQGVDHVSPPASLPANLSAARARLAPQSIVHGSLPEYLAEVRSSGVEWQETRGELRSGYRAYLLGGTISTRMYLKQESHRAERLISRYLETLASIAWMKGVAPYPSSELTFLWKRLLENMPHDSICGCSIDAVHEEMMGRYRGLASFAEGLLARLANAVSPTSNAPPDGNDGNDGAVLVVNPLGGARTDVVETTIRFDRRLLRKVNYETGSLDESSPGEAGAPAAGIVFIDSDGREISGSLDGVTERDIMELSATTQPEMYRVREARVTFVAPGVPSLGCRVFGYRLLPQGRTEVIPPERWIENESVAVRWDKATAALAVRDKRTGAEFAGLCAFEDRGDAGDEYTFSAPRRDTPIALEPGTVKVTAFRNGPRCLLAISGMLEVPESLDGDRTRRSARTVHLPVAIEASLHPGVARVDLRISVDNTAADHRLRVLFPTGMPAASASVEGVFSVEDRPLTPDDMSRYKGWIEPPSTNPQKSFASVSDVTRGLTIANRGLAECEVFGRHGAVIAVTLLRCVGWLSRPDLDARKGNGGWTIPTPGAQCPGHHEFELSIIPHPGDWLTGGGARASRWFETPLRAFGTAARTGAPCTSQYSLVDVDAPEIVVSTVKRAEASPSLIIRCWNSSGAEVTASFTIGFPCSQAYTTNLREERGAAITIRDRAFKLSIGPWKIITIELVPEGASN
jgi:mannosylglycerate hydrolase